MVSTELGKLLVATTPRGVCAVRFGENEAALLRELKHDFKAAEIRRDDAGLEPVATQIKEMLKGSTAPLNIPLDLRGTAFQQMVWKELQRIPSGRDAELHRTGEDDRTAQSGARRGQCVWLESCRGRGSVPSRGAEKRQPGWISLGSEEESGVVGKGAFSH